MDALDLPRTLTLMSQLMWQDLVWMFWYLVVFELPRYALASIALALAILWNRHRNVPPTPSHPAADKLSISVVIAGHNEATAIRPCLVSLAEQTRRPDEIIVCDDGSTDGTRQVLHTLRREKLIDTALCNQVRCGKAAMANFGMQVAKGDIVINLDADCSFDRDAIATIVGAFADPAVGVACGNIGVRNALRSVVAGVQAVEYLISISLGRELLDRLNMIVCASGAFSAYRRQALYRIGIHDPGPGEDFDVTLRLRRAGWRVRFVPESWCMTDVPETLSALVRQRRRWDRDTIRIRLRRFKDTFNPFRRDFRLMETLEQIEFLLFNLLPTLVFPFYIGWLFHTFGTLAGPILVVVAMIYLLLDAICFALAHMIAGRRGYLSTFNLCPYLLVYGMFQGYVMRMVRFYAYVEEWCFRASRRDAYAPKRVLDMANIY